MGYTAAAIAERPWESRYTMSSVAFERIAIVSVTGLPDATGAMLSLGWCQ